MNMLDVPRNLDALIGLEFDFLFWSPVGSFELPVHVVVVNNLRLQPCLKW
jgi:hypothetical protein